MVASRKTSDDDDSISRWRHVPDAFQYVQAWASKFGLRGLTVYFGEQPPLEKLASPEELSELRAAYEEIASRNDAAAISAWCLSIRPQTPANEPKEHIRGLLLLFEKLSDRGLAPFSDGRVRFHGEEPRVFDWSVLPEHLREFEPWLKRFEALRMEHDCYLYAQDASDEQLRELAQLKALLDRDRQALIHWCESSNANGNPAKSEAFQARWLFLLVDFAEPRLGSE